MASTIVRMTFCAALETLLANALKGRLSKLDANRNDKGHQAGNHRIVGNYRKIRAAIEDWMGQCSDYYILEVWYRVCHL